MTDSIRFHPQVPHDIADAIAWYEHISGELANRFRRAVADEFATLRLQPEACAILFDDVRVVRVARFPYLVQYRLLGGTPHVLGVFHAASHPDKWHRRARGDDG